jgi:hypothetical protein
MNKPGVLVVALYSHPEYLPPTLNAIELLSREYDHIYVVHRSITGFDWVYPSNVTLLTADRPMHVREAEAQPVTKKIAEFRRYYSLLARTIREHKSRHLLFYDYMPLLAYRIIKWRIPSQSLLWYHNHDVAEKQYVRKYSLSWFAWKTEKWIFPQLSLFTLPAMERRECFPMERLKGKFVFLPNFPAVKVYGPYQPARIDSNEVRILYQGSISSRHGLEEIIPLLGKKIAGKQLSLVLKGFIGADYLEELTKLAEKHQVKDRLIYKGPGGYREVIDNASTCHIGIAIHKKDDMMNKTLGTASNKIYEYAALGMPALLYDNPHFREHLSSYNWALFTDCSESSLTACLEEIINHYQLYGQQARKDFTDKLNFEHFFTPLIAWLSEKRA